MKARIKKVIAEYDGKISRTRTEIKALRKEIESTRLEKAKCTNIPAFNSLVSLLYDLRREKAVQDKKEMILIQARADFDSLLDFA